MVHLAFSLKFSHMLENKWLHRAIFLMAHFQVILIYFVLKEMQRNLVGIFLKTTNGIICQRCPPSGLCETEISLSSTPVVSRDYIVGRVLQHLNFFNGSFSSNYHIFCSQRDAEKSCVGIFFKMTNSAT